jgi:hypothetical protein
MKLTKLKLAIIGGALVFASCKKKEQELNPQIIDNGGLQVQPDAIALKSFFTNNENQAKQTFSIDATISQSITGNQGTVFQFNGNIFETMSGQAVTGNIDVQLIEIFGKKDMIFQDKPTVANNPLGGLVPLISGGEFKLTVSQSGQPLKLKSWNGYSVTVPAPNGVDPNMSVFYGDTTNDTLVWNGADSSSLQGSGNLYSGYFDSLGWINCDFFYSDPRAKTYVDVQIPTGFTNQTCKLFISFDGLNSITSLYSYSNGVYSSSPSYQLPIGLSVNFVLISIIGGNPHVAIVPATIVNNHVEVVASLTQTTVAQLAIDINNLP